MVFPIPIWVYFYLPRALTGVISHLLPFQQTPSPICSLLRTDVSHHNGAGCREWQHPLPKMTKKLPDTWAWPHLELGAPGSELTFLPGLLRPSREGALQLHPIESEGKLGVALESLQGLRDLT